MVNGGVLSEVEVFAVRVVKLFQYLVENKKEFVLSKQLLRSGTSVGAMVREAEHSESKMTLNKKWLLLKKKSIYIRIIRLAFITKIIRLQA